MPARKKEEKKTSGTAVVEPRFPAWAAWGGQMSRRAASLIGGPLGVPLEYNTRVVAGRWLYSRIHMPRTPTILCIPDIVPVPCWSQPTCLLSVMVDMPMRKSQHNLFLCP